MWVADTNILLFEALTPERMSAAATAAMDAAEGDAALYCSDISLWEIATLIQKGRLSPGVPTLDFIRAVLDQRAVQVLPITPAIAALSASLDLHGDPADRLIAATTVCHRARLVTADHRLREAQAVETIW